MQLSPAASPPLMGFARLSENVPDEVSDPIGFFAPSLALVSLASEVFASSGAREAVSFSDYPLTAFRSPSEYDRLGAVTFRISPENNCLPCGFFPYDAHRSGQPHNS
jgi:hypothetical protein